MELMVFLLLLAGFEGASRIFGADSSDGFDWSDPDLAGRLR